MSEGRTQASGRPESGLLLEVEDLRTYFPHATREGQGRRRRVVHARPWQGARRSSASPGSGKTVLSRSIMGLLSGKSVERSGSIRFAGQEMIHLKPKQMRHIWGQEMSMIFQDPMTSLNPLMKIGKQIAEPLRTHLDESRADAQSDGRAPAARGPHPGGGTAPRAVPARAVGRHAPARDDRHRAWPADPRCCSPTSRPPPSTSRCSRRSSTSSRTSGGSATCR